MSVDDAPPDPESPLGRYWSFLTSTVPRSADDALSSARDDRTKRLARDRAVADEIAARWKSGWDYLDAVVFAMEQNTLIMLDRANKTNDEHSPLREAVLLIQSAATMTVHEICALLHAGLWAGAAGRWRALHELAVTGTLIAKSDPEIAVRYLDHSFVVQTKRLRDFDLVHQRGPVSSVELERRWQRVESLVAAYRSENDPVAFTAAYAWALPLLQPGRSGRRPKPTFEALEDLANMSDLRLLVGTAHGLVHSDAAGITASVIGHDGYYLTPSTRYIEVVARPTLMSISRMTAATHLRFEPELNDFSKLIGLLGGALMENARRATDAFTSTPTGGESEDSRGADSPT